MPVVIQFFAGMVLGVVVSVLIGWWLTPKF